MVLVFLFFVSCNWKAVSDSQNIGKSVYKIYGIDSIGVFVKNKNMSIAFPVDSCTFYLREYSNLKNYLIVEDIKDPFFFDRIDTLFFSIYMNGNSTNRVFNFFTKTSMKYYKSMKNYAKILEVSKYINDNVSCHWLGKGNLSIAAYNAGYTDLPQVPKYYNMLELIMLACKDAHKKESTNIIALEYINEVNKSRKIEWPSYGNHIDSILSIIRR
jgi:hypothetical protein